MNHLTVEIQWYHLLTNYEKNGTL